MNVRGQEEKLIAFPREREKGLTGIDLGECHECLRSRREDDIKFSFYYY